MILDGTKALDTKALLRDLNNLCVELQSTSSSNDKIAILKKHLVTNYHSQDLIKLVRYIYHPTYQFYVTSDNLVKKNHLTGSSYVDIFDLLDDLRTRKITGHDAIGAINTFVSNFPSYADLIHCIIDKDLKTRAGDKIINKVIPDLIPIFEVALAASYEDAKVDFADRWYSSQKMDGCVGYDTIVEFDSGDVLPIGYIVDHKINGNVKSYNHKTGQVEYKPIVNHMKNLYDIAETGHTQWYKITLENGSILNITGNDTVYLPKLKCYRRVDELDGNEEILFDD